MRVVHDSPPAAPPSIAEEEEALAPARPMTRRAELRRVMAALAMDTVMLAASAFAVGLLAPAEARTVPAAAAAYPAVVLILLAVTGRYRVGASVGSWSHLREALAAPAIGALAVSAAG